MSEYLEINSYSPNHIELKKILKALNNNGVIAYPTDSGYALGCKISDKVALKKIKDIRKLDDKHDFTLMCRDLSEISTYAKVDNPTYRLLKKLTPGSYTFILEATNAVPSMMLNKSKKTVGIRVSDHEIPKLIADTLQEAFVSTSLILKGQEIMTDAETVGKNLMHDVDIIIESDYCGYDATTIIDCTGDSPTVTRLGSGEDPFS